jgi:hypothetical protein
VTDLTPVVDASGITPEKSRTTLVTAVDEISGESESTLTHVTRFVVELGTVPDMTPRYGSQLFRPTSMSVTWIDGELDKVQFAGPRVLKNGLSTTESRDTYFDRGWVRIDGTRQPFDRTVLPEAAQQAIAARTARS